MIAGPTSRIRMKLQREGHMTAITRYRQTSKNAAVFTDSFSSLQSDSTVNKSNYDDRVVSQQLRVHELVLLAIYLPGI